MTFIDTSAIYAWVDVNDPQHTRAVDLLRWLLERGEPLLTHSYVLSETVMLLQRRIGVDAALRGARNARQFEIEWVTSALHDEALDRMERSQRRRVSFVDHVSFLVMRQRRIETAFAFDPHFEREGFRLFEP